MEQEESYTPYLERSLDELRKDINLKAEKQFIKPSKTTKICCAILILAFMVFAALNFHYKWVEIYWWSLGVSLCVISLVLYIFHTIKKRIFSAMERASDATQHFRATRKLMLTQKWEEIVGFTLGILFIPFIFHGKIIIEDVFFVCACFIGYVIGAFLLRRTYGNKSLRDFYDDVDELSMYVE